MPFICIANCNRRVDLPIPGSPAKRINEPGTNPPPNTRLNSGSVSGNLRSSLKVTSLIFFGLRLLLEVIKEPTVAAAGSF